MSDKIWDDACAEASRPCWTIDGFRECPEYIKLHADWERLRSNHKDAVETKRRTDARLKWALAGLQRIYNESSDSRMAEIAGEAFERATSPLPPSHSGDK